MNTQFSRRFVAARRWDLFGVALAVVYAIPSFAYPFGGDQPIHWYIGTGILEGQVPYVTGISTKPPAVFVVYALSALLLGKAAWVIRLVDLLFVLAAAYLVATFRPRAPRQALLGLPERDGWFGAAALLVSAVHYTYFDYSDTGHPELWQGVFMLSAVWLPLRASGEPLTGKVALLSGVLASTAVLFKHVAAVAGVVAFFYVLALGARAGPRRALVGAGLYCAGVATPILAVVAVFAALGAFPTLWEVMVEFILHYAGDASRGAPRPVPPWLGLEYGGLAVMLAFAAWCSGFGAMTRVGDRAERRVGLLALLVALTALGSVMIQRRAASSHTFSYYFVVLGPFLGLLMHWGVRVWLRSEAALVAVAACALAVGFLWAPRWPHNAEWSYRQEWGLFTGWVLGKRSREEKLAPYTGMNPLDRYARLERVGLAVRERSRDGDTLCVEGFATPIYQIAGLRCPSRHIVEAALYQGLPRWRKEYERTLRDSPPTFVVTFSDRHRRLRELESMGYVRHDVADGLRPHFVIMERRTDPAAVRAGS